MNIFIKKNRQVLLAIAGSDAGAPTTHAEAVLNAHTNKDEQIIWIDLFCPSSDEVALITRLYNINIPTREEREEIEESARYWEDSGAITINTYFLTRTDKVSATDSNATESKLRESAQDINAALSKIDERESKKERDFKRILPAQNRAKNGDENRDENHATLTNHTITFILCGGILFTIRYEEFRVFDEIRQRVLAAPRNFEDGFDLMSKIFEMRVEKDADLLEDAGKETRALRQSVFASTAQDHDDILEKISTLQELNMSLRDSLFDKRRSIAAVIRSDKPDADVKKNLTIVLKDLNSLVEFTSVNMNALDNIQNILTNQINIEQNKTIKFFTVMTVAMMPPTLIGTVYGMNFKFMPELEWEFAYPVVLLVMALSIVVPIIYFRRKGWL